MKRVLTFDGEKGSKRFSMLRMALLSAGDGKAERTRDVIRKEARLLDLLDTVSVEKGADDRELDTKIPAPSITVDQADFELLSQYVDKTPWVPRVSRDAVDLFDFLSAAEKVEV